LRRILKCTGINCCIWCFNEKSDAGHSCHVYCIVEHFSIKAKLTFQITQLCLVDLNAFYSLAIKNRSNIILSVGATTPRGMTTALLVNSSSTTASAPVVATIRHDGKVGQAKEE